MFRNLPEGILIERNIIHSAEHSEGILRNLPQLLDTLSKDKKTASFISALEKKLKNFEKELDQNMEKAIDWVKEIIIKLRTSLFVRDSSNLYYAIERVESALQNTDNLPSTIHLDRILANLQIAVSSLASLENDTFFQGWAKTRMPIRQRNFSEKNDNCQTTELPYGVLVELLLPDYIKHMLSRKGSKGLQRWKSHRESNAATLLDFLKTLSKYSLCESTAEPNFLRLRCAQDAEELCLQGHPWPYLRQFSLEDPKDHPLSREQVLCLIDTFLNMAERQICQQSDKPPPKVNTASKKDTRVFDKKIAVEWMKIEWLNDRETCRDMIVGELIREIDNGTVKLSRKYERSTYNNWARDADPLPIEDRLRRPKTKNR